MNDCYRGPNIHLVKQLPGKYREQSDHALSVSIGCWIQEQEMQKVPIGKLQACVMTNDKFGDATVFVMRCHGVDAIRTNNFTDIMNFFQFGRK